MVSKSSSRCAGVGVGQGRQVAYQDEPETAGPGVQPHQPKLPERRVMPSDRKLSSQSLAHAFIPVQCLAEGFDLVVRRGVLRGSDVWGPQVQ
jgi:hypothetical protein